MSFPRDLLDQAAHLAKREPRKPRQASLRRAVSAAYYALFHLLIEAAVSNWKRPGQRPRLARAFEHGWMKEAAKKVLSRSDLKTVAAAFVSLQEERHSADYDSERIWSRQEVLRLVDLASNAFRAWSRVKESIEAQDFLLSLLLKARR